MKVISAQKLAKVFSGKVRAVDGVDLEVEAGTIFGFLGPNGAGKTTTLRLLTTLLPIDMGEAMVAGYDVRRESHKVRRHIGYVSQLGGADRLASAREDLELQGEIYGLSRSVARKRADELIKDLELEDFADRRTNTYSGGQKRRLHVALGLVHRPEVLFLDEPTTGLDPQNRANLWVQIRRLCDTGTTVFLTTHYMEEADTLSDCLAIMDHGKIVAEGTAKELKQQISGDSIVISFKDNGRIAERAAGLLKQQPFTRELAVEGEHIRLYAREGAVAMPEIIRLLDSNSLQVSTIAMSEPTLDDVFLRQTGRSLRDTGPVPGNRDAG